jgi:hypothetical protein
MECYSSSVNISVIVSRITPLVDKLSEYHEKIVDLQRNYEKILDKKEHVEKEKYNSIGYMWSDKMYEVHGKRNLKNFVDRYSKFFYLNNQKLTSYTKKRYYSRKNLMK